MTPCDPYTESPESHQVANLDKCRQSEGLGNSTHITA